VHCEVARVVGTNIALPADKQNPRQIENEDNK
jgi:hypothetical protein